MPSKRIVMVSADGHAGAPIEHYLDYIEPRFRDELAALIPADEEWRDNAISQRRFGADVLDVIDRGDAIRSGGERGAWEVDRRLAELDREGVAAEVLLPGHQLALLPFFSIINGPSRAELRAAGARAYHRHLAANLKFPFRARSEGDGSSLTVHRLPDPKEYGLDEEEGLLCEARSREGPYDVPLSKLDEAGSGNRRLVGDYGYWFGNYG